ncbi:MAG TPA: zinc dependent phospholipase C family protein [Flavipsychrobacter sp.]|nr:zinc dependent phospholipase C family protein [Flavipsychrobacter sp.]
MKKFALSSFFILVLICILYSADQSYAYSVLSHEAIIDAAWDKILQPLLIARYHDATPDQLKEAHAYAYGGSVAPDMGYYPFGSKFFTNVVHYVRSGDFVSNLLDESQNIDEYAFALGVLCHYYADKCGHPIGTNRSVPLTYPKDKEKYGYYVTYEQDPVTHVRMEFGFDVLQTARGNYASEKYQQFIGFKIDTAVLNRAFAKTYGLNITDVFGDFPLAASTFRWTIKSFFPILTRAAWASRKKDIQKSHPTITRRKFEYRMRNANYYHEYGKKRQRPGLFPGILADIIRILPKVGPLKDLKLKVPGTDAEKLFIQSFDTTISRYTAALQKLRSGKHHFENINWDTGNDTYAGEYNLADDTYGELLLRLKKQQFKNVDVALRNNILAFYSKCNEKTASLAGADRWHDITVALDQLKEYHPAK